MDLIWFQLLKYKEIKSIGFWVTLRTKFCAKFEIHVRNITCGNMFMQNCADNLQQGAKWNNVNKKSMQ